MLKARAPRGLGIVTFFQEMSEGLRRQGNVIFALIFKEFLSDSMGRSGMSLLWVLVEPAVYSLSMATIWYLIKRQYVDGIPIADYLLISFLPFLIVQQSIINVSRSISRSESFFTFQQVKPIDALLARFVLDMSLLILGTVLAMTLMWWFFGHHLYFDRIDEAIWMLVVALAMGLGLALLIGTYGSLYPFLYTIIGLPMRALMILSGVIIPPSDLPMQAQIYISWNPLASLVDSFRNALFHSYPFIGSSRTYAEYVALAVLFFGFLAYYPNRLRLAANR